FDCPDSSLPEPRRVSTVSPLQALSLLNHSFTTDMAEAFGNQSVESAFLRVFGRAPEPGEVIESNKLIREHGFTAFVRALFNANEFLYVY
ncbi:MAG: DUF1553 domain-containing protein, partial [Acidobacteria bacterium]|nr:DUF1553 domain-containing protein [Acidobacteriota bacterium]